MEQMSKPLTNLREGVVLRRFFSGLKTSIKIGHPAEKLQRPNKKSFQKLSKKAPRMASVIEGLELDATQGQGGGDAPPLQKTPPTQIIKAEGGRQQEPGPAPVFIIREIYDSENANEIFEQQLEHALANEVETIVIEPFKLGDETARWISVGNCLHKTAVLAGLGSMLSAFVWPDKPIIFVPATILSTLCTGLYSISWQFDPCCKYQVETDARQLAQISLQTINSSSPIVLVRKDDTRRKILHSAITAACLSQTLLRLYFPFLNSWFGRTSGRVLGLGPSSSSSSDCLVVSGRNGVPSSQSNTTSFIGTVFGGGLDLL